MKAVVQRVTRAVVVVDGTIAGQIGTGLFVLLGVARGDGNSDVRYIAEKLRTMRIFSDEQGKMNRSLAEVNGAILLVSQFTLLGDTAKGRRPGFDDAAPPDHARALYEQVAAELRTQGISVQTGVFAAHMRVELVNDGPVTMLLDSRRTI